MTYDSRDEFNQLSPNPDTAIQRGDEFGQSAQMVRAQQEVQGSIIVAKRFPRSEDAAYQKLISACKRTSFAEKAEYKFPRGGQTVSGPSAHIAREALRVWGNMQSGTEVIRDTDTERHIRSFAWDVENNTRKVAEATFKKKIFRKGKGLVDPDERDLREMTNRFAAINERNCILQLIPADVIEDAVREARKTLQAETERDPGAVKKRLISAFDDIHVPVAELEAYLGHSLDTCSSAELDDLRAIYSSIRDGNSIWGEYVEAKFGPSPVQASGNVAKNTQAKTAEMAAKYANPQPAAESVTVHPPSPSPEPKGARSRSPQTIESGAPLTFGTGESD